MNVHFLTQLGFCINILSSVKFSPYSSNKSEILTIFLCEKKADTLNNYSTIMTNSVLSRSIRNNFFKIIIP